MLCPECNQELTKGKTKWMCEECGYMRSLETVTSADELFFTEAFDSFYPLLAHEYHVLYDFVKNKNYYGALLQYKDVLEIILKFPVLIAINDLWRKAGYDLSEGSREKAILAKLLGKYSGLSLGDWKSICEDFAKLYGEAETAESPDLAQTLKPLLEAVHTFYSKENIVHWRNEKIGHGALQANLDSDAGFINDFTEKLKKLKAHFEVNRRLYEGLEVLSESGAAIKGKSSVGHTFEAMRIRIAGAVCDQTPFMLVKNNAANLFDSAGKSAVYVLDYTSGSKAKHDGGLLDDFAAKRKMILTAGQIEQLDDAKLISDDTFINTMLDTLSKAADEKEAFQSPEYIVDYIKNDFLKKEKGVLLLQMERGMGKTTLMRALDQLAMKKVPLDDGRGDTAVRAYYINNLFAYRINHFLSESCNHILTDISNFTGPGERIVLSNIALPPVSAGGDDTAGDFAGFLSALLEKGYKQHTSATKLVFIIDGLDEIRLDESEEGSIFDCIPSPAILDDGVYIILTARTDNEVPAWILKKFEGLAGEKSAERKVYVKSDENNIGVLRRYLKKQLAEEQVHMADTIIKKADYRFLHVKALRELMRDTGFDIAEFSSDNFGEKIMGLYLGVLKSKYGASKFYADIKRLLVIISILDEAVTVEELSYLYNFEPASLRFIGYLSDLKGLLRIDRADNIERIGAMHDEWKQALTDENPEMIQEIINAWVDRITDDARANADDAEAYMADKAAKAIGLVSDGVSYLAANIHSLIETYHPAAKSALSGTGINRYLFKLAREIAGVMTAKSQARCERILTHYINAMRDKADPSVDIEDEDISVIEINLAYAYIFRGKHRMLFSEAYKALEDFNECITIMAELSEEYEEYSEELFDETFSDVYNERGAVYKTLTVYDLAMADYNNALEIARRMQAKGEPQALRKIAMICNNRCAIHVGMGRLDLALADIDQSLEAEMKFIKQDKTRDISLDGKLATTRMNRGLLYSELKNYKKAIADLDYAIKTFEAIKRKNNPLKDSLAKAYLSRAGVYREMGDLKRSMDDYVRCQQEWDRLRAMGAVIDESSVFSLYFGMSSQHIDAGDYERAMEYCVRAEDLLKQMQSEGTLYGESKPVSIHLRKGQIFNALENYEGALAELTKGIDIMLQLPVWNERAVYDDVPRVYNERGFVHFSLGNYVEAAADYGRAIEIKSLEEDLHDDPGKMLGLAENHYIRGIAYSHDFKYEAAVDDFVEAIKIYEKLRAEGKLISDKSLTGAYDNLREAVGAIADRYENASDYSGALQCFDYLIEILAGDWKPYNLLPQEEDILAGAYMSRGHVHSLMTEQLADALSDYNRCVEIRERLYEAGKLPNENGLAKAYMNRGLTHAILGANADAMADSGRCFETMEKMRRTGKVFDENDLAIAYYQRAFMHGAVGDNAAAVADRINALRILKTLFADRPGLQKEYFDDLAALIELIEYKNDGQFMQSVLDEFLYTMVDSEKTEEAEAVFEELLDTHAQD